MFHPMTGMSYDGVTLSGPVTCNCMMTSHCLVQWQASTWWRHIVWSNDRHPPWWRHIVWSKDRHDDVILSGPMTGMCPSRGRRSGGELWGPGGHVSVWSGLYLHPLQPCHRQRVSPALRQPSQRGLLLHCLHTSQQHVLHHPVWEQRVKRSSKATDGSQLSAENKMQT